MDHNTFVAVFGTPGRGGGGCSGDGQPFNGSDQCAYVADNGDLDIAEASTDFCISAKINTGNDIASANQYFLGKPVAGGIQGRYGFYISVGTLVFLCQSSGGVVSINDNLVLATNTEYHILVRIDLNGSRIYFYIDGVLQNAGGTPFTGSFPTMINAYEFVMGCANASGGGSFTLYGSCTLYDVRVYHKNVTSAGDIALLQGGSEVGDEIAWWCLPGLTDISSNSFDLIGVNL